MLNPVPDTDPRLTRIVRFVCGMLFGCAMTYAIIYRYFGSTFIAFATSPSAAFAIGAGILIAGILCGFGVAYCNPARDEERIEHFNSFFPSLFFRFFCGAVIGLVICAYLNWRDVQGVTGQDSAQIANHSLLLWSGVIGAIFALTSVFTRFRSA